MSVYKIQRRLASADVDMFLRLKSSALFTMIQESSVAHSELLGVGRAKTFDRGLLWVVILQNAEILRVPVYDETITLETWPGRTMHKLFPRYHRVADENGATLINAVSLWSLVDQNTRSAVFPEEYGIFVAEERTGREMAFPTAPSKLAEIEKLSFTVPYSCVDMNGHMNNAEYISLAEDCVHAAEKGFTLSKIKAEYLSEVKLGDEIELSVGLKGNKHSVEGCNENRLFRIELDYSED